MEITHSTALYVLYWKSIRPDTGRAGKRSVVDASVEARAYSERFSARLPSIVYMMNFQVVPRGEK